MNLSDSCFRLPGYISLIILLVLIITCGGEIKEGSGVTVINYEEDTGGLAVLSPPANTRGGVMHEDDSLSHRGRNMESSQTHVLKISDFREIISLDIIQHEKVKVIFTHNDETSDEIRAQLHVPECQTSRACPQLSLNVTHSHTRSHISLSVHPSDKGYDAGACVMWALVLLVSFLCIWYMIRLIKTFYRKETRSEKHQCSCRDNNKNINKKTDDNGCLSSPTNHEDSGFKPQNVDLKCSADTNDVNNVTIGEPWCEKCSSARVNMSDEGRQKQNVIRVFWRALSWSGLILGLAVTLLLGALYVSGGNLYFGKEVTNAVLTVAVPNKAHIRHVRSYSTSPDLRDVTMDNSLALITRLQLLDLTADCRDNLSRCRTHALCEGGDAMAGVRCRCNTGYFLQDLKCTACKTSCGVGFYMSNQCSDKQDVICKPCRQCEGTSYNVAPCTTTQDAICVDVTFPIKQFEQRTSPQKLIELNVSMSQNVFLEQLHFIKRLETPLYISNNRQELQFIWRRLSGLDIRVTVSDIYLVPVYADIDHADDLRYIKDVKNKNFPDDIKKRLDSVINQYCRHPLPDGYDLFLNISPNTSTAAREMTCDSKNFNLPPCPRSYKDGDKYIYKALDRKCRKEPGNVPTYRSKVNNILCMDNPEILSKIFRKSVNSSTALTFPSEECQNNATDCHQCLSRRACSPATNSSDCCNKACYARKSCRQLYSSGCPETPIECTRGDITKYTMIPRYQNIRQQYECHLRHRPPESLYLVTYEAFIPSMQFSFGARHKKVRFRSRRLQEDGVDKSDYLYMIHHTILPVHDEVILVGTYPTERSNATYTLHELKESWEFDRYRPFDVVQRRDESYKTSIQFETPFLYTTSTWQREGCDRNVSRIVPQQPIYKQIGEPLETPITKRPGRNLGVMVDSFEYQLRSVGTAPHIRFSSPENTSILSYYKEELADAKLNTTSLRGNVFWDAPSQIWNVTIAGVMTSCPGVFTVEIFTEATFTQKSVYDVLVICPNEFNFTFVISRDIVDVPDMFTAVLNDSVSSYRLVLTSIQELQYFSNHDNKMVDMSTKEQSPWIPIIVVFAVCSCTSMFLVIIYLYCDGQKSKRIPIDITVPKPNLGTQITLLQNIDLGARKVTMSLKTKCLMFTLVVLYLVYALTFTFSSMFGLLHLMHGSNMGEILFSSNTSAKLESHMHTKLLSMIDYENNETSRMIKSVEERLNACSYHLKSTFYEDIPEINKELTTALSKIFQQNGTVQSSLRSYYEYRMASYEHEIKQFVDECNKTLEANLHKLHMAYSSYLNDLADNDWFTFPRQLFLDQQRGQGRRLSEVKDNLAKFLTWLEIDKVQEIMEIKHMLMQRLTAMMPRVNFSSILDDTDTPDGVNLTVDVAAHWYTFSSDEKSFDQNLLKDIKTENKDTISSEDSNNNLISNIKGILYPLFISVFLVLDMLLLAYRLSWLCKCIHRFRTGVEQRVPFDSITRNIHFILTGVEVARPGDSLDHPYDYYMNNKENIWGKNTEMYFLYCQASPKSKEDILREILTHKRGQKPKTITDKKQHCCCVRYGLKLTRFMYGVFISPVFWRFLLICAFVLFVCLIAKATDDLVTMESAMFLIDTDAMLPILARQNLITNTIISQQGDYLNGFLATNKDLLDGEIETLNQILVDVTGKQSTLLSSLISDMCNLGGGAACTGVPIQDMVTFTFTSCNFLPLQIHPYTGFHENIISEFLISELSPLVTNLRIILFNAFYLLLTFAATMLICQICARIIFVYLWKSRHLRTTKIYQLPSTVDQWHEQQSFREKDIYVSQSLIAESCESGVYDMTA